MQNDYLTRQKPFRALFIFSLPMIIGNLFQQTYMMADSAIGGGIGASVVVSRYFGAGQYDKMKLAVLSFFVFLWLLRRLQCGHTRCFSKEELLRMAASILIFYCVCVMIPSSSIFILGESP